MHKQSIALNEDTIDPRSEEHTSELQSRLHLVCRLLLEKKKNAVIAEHDACRGKICAGDSYPFRCVAVALTRHRTHELVNRRDLLLDRQARQCAERREDP